MGRLSLVSPRTAASPIQDTYYKEKEVKQHTTFEQKQSSPLLSITESACIAYDNRILSDDIVWNTITDIESYSNYFSFVQSTKIINKNNNNKKNNLSIDSNSTTTTTTTTSTNRTIPTTTETANDHLDNTTGTTISGSNSSSNSSSSGNHVIEKGTIWEEVRQCGKQNSLLVKQVLNTNYTVTTTTISTEQLQHEQQQKRNHRIRSMQLLISFPSKCIISSSIRNRNQTKHNQRQTSGTTTKNEAIQFGIHTSTILLETPIVDNVNINHHDDDNNNKKSTEQDYYHHQSRIIVTMAYIHEHYNWFFDFIVKYFGSKKLSQYVQESLQKEINEIIIEASRRQQQEQNQQNQ